MIELNTRFRFGLAVVAVGLATALGLAWSRAENETTPAARPGFVVPTFSHEARLGSIAYDSNCAICHGIHAAGTDQGPPLVHDIYNPGHHGDAAFYAAVRSGSRQHHWPFGDMPAQTEVSEAQVEQIIHYIRELQRANGITYRRHDM